MRAPTPTISAAPHTAPRQRASAADDDWTEDHLAAIDQMLDDLAVEDPADSDLPPSDLPPPASPQEFYVFNPAVLREVLFAAIHDLSESQDDKIRLGAAVGGLRALAQLEALELRKQRLEQQRELIDLSRAHLELLQRREQRAIEREKNRATDLCSERSVHSAPGSPTPSRPNDHDQAEAEASADPLRAPNSELPAPEPHPDAPLTEDEVNEARDRFPGVQPHRYRLAELTRYWRNKIREDRHKDAVLAARRAHTAPAPTAPAATTRAPAAANPPPTSPPSHSSSTTSTSSPPTQPEAPPPPRKPRPPDP